MEYSVFLFVVLLYGETLLSFSFLINKFQNIVTQMCSHLKRKIMLFTHHQESKKSFISLVISSLLPFKLIPQQQKKYS